MITHNELIRGQ